ncbi:hypothetical protein [Nocardia australiensis]|uniref:hypothetical protein n=1 Tax=Nocardia australiensis TaxID=2887191 RepID=UPI001D132F41|nr:hypothetical protein [Nocardia australiensis]
MGSAGLELVEGVALLRPETLCCMRCCGDGRQAQQVCGRCLTRSYVRNQLGVVRRFVDYTNAYPWQWTPAHVDEWSVDLISGRDRAKSTISNYQSAVKLFCEYLIRPEYGWARGCEDRFGTHPVQVCFEWNTLAHLSAYEGAAERRPMTRQELQRFFDYADDQVEFAIRRRRKGALAAYRDATLFKVIYAYGLRAREAALRAFELLVPAPRQRQPLIATVVRRHEPDLEPARIDLQRAPLGQRRHNAPPAPPRTRNPYVHCSSDRFLTELISRDNHSGVAVQMRQHELQPPKRLKLS